MSAAIARRTGTVAACLVGGYLAIAYFSRPETLPVRERLESLPMVIAGWTGRRAPNFNATVEAVLGVDDYVVRDYSSASEAPVGLYVGYHTSQRQGDTIHSPLNCLPGAGWQPLQHERTTVAVSGTGTGGGTTFPITVNRVVIGKGLERQLVLYWYQSHRRVVASEYWGKVFTVLDAVAYDRTDAALVRIITPILEGDTASRDAERRATAFAQGLFPHLQRHF